MDIELRNILDANAPNFTEDFEDRTLSITSTVTCPRRFDERTRKTVPCTCASDACDSVASLLTFLAGPDGKHCGRCISLVLAPSSTQYLDQRAVMNDREGQIARVLRYPMPKLIALSIHCFINKEDYRSEFPFLKYAPLLTHLALNNCIIYMLPNAANLEFLGISWTHYRSSYHWGEKGVWPTLMPRLKVLKLNFPGLSLQCPKRFPELQTFDVRGYNFLWTRSAKPALSLTSPI